MKNLSEMTLQELWHLFPIELVPHNDIWFEYYQEMSALLSKKLNSFDGFCINHIGSTSITTIWAKPIVDILVEVSKKCNLDDIATEIKSLGFLEMSRAENRISFNYGYTPNGFASKVYHLHLRYLGDRDELYFKNYLIDNPQVAKDYQTLKLELLDKFKYDRDAYTQSKTEFVKHYTQIAKDIYNIE